MDNIDIQLDKGHEVHYSDNHLLHLDNLRLLLLYVFQIHFVALSLFFHLALLHRENPPDLQAFSFSPLQPLHDDESTLNDVVLYLQEFHNHHKDALLKIRSLLRSLLHMIPLLLLIHLG